MDEYGDEGDAFTFEYDSDDSEAKRELEIALYSQIYFQADEETELLQYVGDEETGVTEADKIVVTSTEVPGPDSKHQEKVSNESSTYQIKDAELDIEKQSHIVQVGDISDNLNVCKETSSVSIKTEKRGKRTKVKKSKVKNTQKAKAQRSASSTENDDGTEIQYYTPLKISDDSNDSYTKNDTDACVSSSHLLEDGTTEKKPTKRQKRTIEKKKKKLKEKGIEPKEKVVVYIDSENDHKRNKKQSKFSLERELGLNRDVVSVSSGDDSETEQKATFSPKRKLKSCELSEADAGEVIELSSSNSSDSQTVLSISSSDSSDSENEALSDVDPRVFPVDIDLNVKNILTGPESKHYGLDDILDSLEDCDWSLIQQDRYKFTADLSLRSRYYTPPLQVKCQNCGQRGHLSKICPKPQKIPACILCGYRGHTKQRCELQHCRNCQAPGHTRYHCAFPQRSYKFQCNTCYMLGHGERECSNIWRQFHLTTSVDRLQHAKVESANKKKYCSNCGVLGHFDHDCLEQRMDFRDTPHYALIPYYDLPGELRAIQEAEEFKPLPHQSATLVNSNPQPGQKRKFESVSPGVVQFLSSRPSKSVRSALDYPEDFNRGYGDYQGEPSRKRGKFKIKKKKKITDWPEKRPESYIYDSAEECNRTSKKGGKSKKKRHVTSHTWHDGGATHHRGKSKKKGLNSGGGSGGGGGGKSKKYGAHVKGVAFRDGTTQRDVMAPRYGATEGIGGKGGHHKKKQRKQLETFTSTRGFKGSRYR